MTPKQTTTRTDARRGGFTLVELLVATTIISVIMMTVYHTFSTGLNAWNRSDAQLNRLEDGRNLLNGLSAELASASLPLPEEQPSFWGGANQLIFFTGSAPADRSVAAGRCTTRLTYTIEGPPQGAPAGGLTVRRTRQFFAGEQPIGEPASADVLTGVQSLRLEYLPAGPIAGDNPPWQAEWTRPGDPPRAVRISLVLAVPLRGGQTASLPMTAVVPVQVRLAKTIEEAGP